VKHWLRNVGLALVAIGGLGLGQARAVIPESGMYWNPSYPGLGYYIEHQNGVVTLIIYAYDETGDPEFYIASGQLLTNVPVEPGGWGPGRLPAHGLSAPLFRVTNGRFITSPLPRPGVPDFLNARVGSVRVLFDFHNAAEVEVLLDAPPAGQAVMGTAAVQRFNFALGSFGTNAISNARACWPDFRGQWVFVDESNSSRAPWRFNFTEAAPFPAEQTCPSPNVDHGVVFRDPSRNAELRCASRNGRADPQTGRTLVPGCELWQDGVAQFSIAQPDLGLRRMVGSVGELSTFTVGQPATLRKPERVLGMRMD
jgi:hypothetical protein